MALRRGALTLLLALACLFAAGGGGAAANTLDYACSPPAPATTASCSGWHTSAITVHWVWDQFVFEAPPGTCESQTFATDTSGTLDSCEVYEIGNPDNSIVGKVTIRVDTTPPVTTGATPDRPPDFDGWWTHPVVFSFAGSDATSGIANCDKVNYSGPDGAAASVTGSCRDVAGNSSSTAVALKYDATPPTVGDAAAAPGDASAKVSWSPSADVVRSEVARTPGETAAPSQRVFDGTTSSFMDVGLLNGVTYSYTITVFDQAGNSATAAVSTIPAALPAAVSSLPKSGANARVISPPLLRWKRVRHARYYNVQLFRGRHKLLSVWPVKPQLQLRKTWRFRGHRYTLTRARYRWYVWPGYGARAARRYGALVRKGAFFYRP